MLSLTRISEDLEVSRPASTHDVEAGLLLRTQSATTAGIITSRTTSYPRLRRSVTTSASSSTGPVSPGTTTPAAAGVVEAPSNGTAAAPAGPLKPGNEVSTRGPLSIIVPRRLGRMASIPGWSPLKRIASRSSAASLRSSSSQEVGEAGERASTAARARKSGPASASAKTGSSKVPGGGSRLRASSLFEAFTTEKSGTGTTRSRPQSRRPWGAASQQQVRFAAAAAPAPELGRQAQDAGGPDLTDNDSLYDSDTSLLPSRRHVFDYQGNGEKPGKWWRAEVYHTVLANPIF